MSDDKELQPEPEVRSGNITLDDIYFVLFRQKWLILACSILGVIAAATLFLITPLHYQSTAKLFIRYVVTGKSLNPHGGDPNARALGDHEKGILDTEIEILRSFDLARQVADTVGAERLLAKAGGGGDPEVAAGLVLKNLTIDQPANGSVFMITFRHPDPDIARETLSKTILAYYKKHAEAHQPVEMFGDFLTQEIDRLRAQLAQTEAELKMAKSKAGVMALDDGKKAYTDQISKIREALFLAEAELAGQLAALGHATNVGVGSADKTNVVAEAAVPAEQVNEYREVQERLAALAKRRQDLLISGLKEGSTWVQEVRERIVEAEKLKARLEAQYPGLTRAIMTLPAPGGLWTATGSDLAAAEREARKLTSMIQTLKSQLAQLQAEAGKLDEMEDVIQELQRKKELLEADLKYYSASLEQSRINKAAGSGNAPNIGVIEPPTPSGKKWPKSFKKKVAMIGVGGFALGVALAFLIELQIDRSVKRGVEVENKLKLPLFMTIPDVQRNHPRRRTGKAPPPPSDSPDGSGHNHNSMAVAAWEREHPLRRFYEGLRNRLIVHFEIWNLKHKPKMVAVTSCGRGAGVSSTAAGLAASLSETGDGSVLLVDMNCERGTAQHFYKGEAISQLDDALTKPAASCALVHTNLYATENLAGADRLPEALPRRFATLVPKFKGSDYDFIIFDMPPVSQTSVTPRLAGFMDMVLLVIESEKTHQDVVKRANALLGESKANVRAVLNRTRSYVPERLQPKLPDDH